MISSPVTVFVPIQSYINSERNLSKFCVSVPIRKNTLDQGEEPPFIRASTYPICRAQGGIVRRQGHALHACLEESIRAFHAEEHHFFPVQPQTKNKNMASIEVGASMIM